MSNYFKQTAVAIFTVAFLAIGVWDFFFQIDNELGPAGADKVGRQVLIQTLSHYLSEDSIGRPENGYTMFDVGSERTDRPLISRLFQEPMRTTFRLFADPLLAQEEPRGEFAQHFLNQPYHKLHSLFAGPITIRDDFEVSPEDLDQRMRQLGVKTTEDYLSAWEFRRFELYRYDDLVAAHDLREIGQGNRRRGGL